MHTRETKRQRQTDRQTNKCTPVSVIEGQSSAEAGTRDAKLDSSGHNLPPGGLHRHKGDERGRYHTIAKRLC